jgi:hypothetical protein
MTLRNQGRLAIHRRSDEIAFLQHWLRVLSEAQVSLETGETHEDHSELMRTDFRAAGSASADERDMASQALMRERDLTDELLHTRQTEPLGETLQRRLAMAELICHDLRRRAGPVPQNRLPAAYSVAEIERRALVEMLNRWWLWLRES